MYIKNSKKIPNIFIVGAPKAGTTSLVQYLSKYKEVFFPEIKEPHFMYNSKMPNHMKGVIRNIYDYENLYSNSSAKFMGDASVFGMLFYKESIENIKLYSHEPKIIILLRDPVDRAYSAYLQLRRYSDFNYGSFLEVFFSKESKTPMDQLLKGSLYYDAISAYKANFTHVKIISSKSLFDRPDIITNQVAEFIGVTHPDKLDSDYPIRNKGSTDFKNSFIRYIFKNIFNESFRKNLKHYFPLSHKLLKNTMIEFLFSKAPPIDNNDRITLYPYFSDDIEKIKKDYNFLNFSK